ncbi:TPM domain-containing protein [Corynebacterium silvaticum]|uniref:TPM domain-containing protein n=1 Tax=Corynebacterium silvaticum TaxID=2320431 RepID=A0A7U5HML2_9CORY|nr:TPM domain-containing protein [Corynebacterium silvaticum]ARU46543.1 TPM domain-containing protein [Corynebacterium silvaticum]UWG99765.1 TPM domain-containing protein [Corynebacterium silvaticum]UWH01811.1 TPM domain-containing protein [Corynebacterium silvaticum]UWH03848.1 TPM domain-containing protein [Corynebacterium silvaticum]UXZ26009.1 TPM domain-containing protein [Corynebacterium silvaticum]
MHTRVKTTWVPSVRRSAATVCGSALLLTPLLGIAPLAFIPPLATAEHVHVQAEAPQKYTKPVTDATGTLTKAQIEEISTAISEFQKAHRRQIRVVFVHTFDGLTPEAWTKKAVESNGGANVAVYALALDSHEFGIDAGAQWPDSLDNMYNAVYDKLQQQDWAGSALALVANADNTSSASPAGGSSASTQADGQSAAWLGAGAVGIAGVGGGLWVWSRRKRKADDQAVLEQGRAIEPGDATSLAQLPTPALETLAQEELVSTDESIQRGKEELSIAVAEFSAERTRSFNRAMNESTTTLQRAFQLKHQLDTTSSMDQLERRSLLIEIISSCGTADAALDAEAANFAELRNLLVNAPQQILKLTQSTVDVSARIPVAEQTLSELKAKYSPTMIASIEHNAEMAKVSVAEAERCLDTAGEIQNRPAGEQSGMADAIRGAENALTNAEKLIVAIEHAESTIMTAQTGIPALIAEIDAEIAEATQLREQGMQQGTQLDWDSLDNAVTHAREAVRQAQSQGTVDPLGTWSALTDADTHLDDQLDIVRKTTTDHARQLQLFNQQFSAASASVQAAQDFISTRGRVIGAEARTKLADAQRLIALAQQAQGQDLRTATTHARQAGASARASLDKAQRDVDRYQQRNNNSSGGTGALVAGMVLNEILSNGRRGGFGGGFGGFSGGGGGFSGGGFRGGSF